MTKLKCGLWRMLYDRGNLQTSIPPHVSQITGVGLYLRWKYSMVKVHDSFCLTYLYGIPTLNCRAKVVQGFPESTSNVLSTSYFDILELFPHHLYNLRLLLLPPHDETTPFSNGAIPFSHDICFCLLEMSHPNHDMPG